MPSFDTLQCKCRSSHYVKRLDMASRQAIFGIANEPGDENDKLVELFRNRAELKKEFAKLRLEGEQLKEQLQHQEGVTLRAQQRLDGVAAHCSIPWLEISTG